VHVLVVDDDRGLRELLAELLAELGHAADTAASVGDAIVAIEVCAPEAVVSDYELGGATGLDLLAYVRCRLPRVPFVLVSGAMEPQLARVALDAGALRALSKAELADVLPAVFGRPRAPALATA
jgi:DNA-binding NtrC family response regulator